MAVAFRDLADRGFRPRGDLLYFAVADEEAGSAHGARWVADHHPDAIRCDYVLTESGGLHDGPPEAPVDRRHGRREGRGVAAAARARHAGPRLDAVPHRQRAGQGGGRRAAPRRVPAGAPLPRAVARRGSSRSAVARRAEGSAARPGAHRRLRSPSCRTRPPPPTSTPAPTRRSRPTSIDGGVMKTNVIPDSVDARRRRAHAARRGHRRGRRPTCGRRSATSPTHVEIEVLMDDPASISRIDTPLWDALQRAVTVPFPGARLAPQFTVGFTDARVFRELGAVAYGAGLFSPHVDAGRVRPPLPRPRRARRRRVARPDRRAVAARGRRPDGLSEARHTPVSIGLGRRAVSEQLGEQRRAGGAARSTTGRRRPPRRARRASTTAARGRRSARSCSQRQPRRGLERPPCARGRSGRAGRPTARRRTGRCAGGSRHAARPRRRCRPSSSSSSRRSVASVVLARLLAAAGRGPHGGRRELEAHEEHAVGRIERPPRGPTSGSAGAPWSARPPGGQSSGVSGRSSLNALYMS